VRPGCGCGIFSDRRILTGLIADLIDTALYVDNFYWPIVHITLIDSIVAKPIHEFLYNIHTSSDGKFFHQ
jgi:hypothetical protein